MTKEEKAQFLNQKLHTSNILRFCMRATISNVVGSLDEEVLDGHLDSIAAYEATLAYKIEDAMNFANKVMIEFTTENIVMGITQDGMTGTVRKRLNEVIMCLLTGSLYDAITEIKALPLSSKDSKYLTNERLTIFINKIEDYLKIPRTTVV